MNAWLITWEGTSAQLSDENRIAAILGSRLSDRSIAEFVEFIYLRNTSTAGDMAKVANVPKRRNHRAILGDIINGVPHGGRVTCGHNPWLYARKVTSLKVVRDEGAGVETISWQEPPIFRWLGDSRTAIEREKEGRKKSIDRPEMKMLSDEMEQFYA